MQYPYQPPLDREPPSMRLRRGFLIGLLKKQGLIHRKALKNVVEVILTELKHLSGLLMTLKTFLTKRKNVY